MTEEIRNDLDIESAEITAAGDELRADAGNSADDFLGEDLNGTAEVETEVSPGEPRLFDFNRPYSLSRVFEKNMQSICEGFVKAAGLGFTNQFRANTTVEFQGLELSTYRDFYSELPNPTCIATVSMPPMKGLSVIHFDMGLAFSLMKKMLGGPIEPEVDLRKFTDIELGLTEGIFVKLLDHFKTGAARMVPLTPSFVAMENNPIYLNAIPAGETVLLINFALSIEEITGGFCFCIPLAAIDPVRDQLDPDETPELRSDHEVNRDRGQVLDLIQGTGADMVVELGNVEMNLNSILELQEGDLLQLGKSVQAPLEVRVQGKPVFQGLAGRRNQHRAVKITERVREEDRDADR